MQFSMFAEETQLERLSKLGDSLEKLKLSILNPSVRNLKLHSAKNGRAMRADRRLTL